MSYIQFLASNFPLMDFSLQKYSGVEFLGPLVKEMTRNRPSDRPNAKDLRVKFNTIRNRLTAHQIRAHLEAKNTSDPLREHLAALGIESILESESDDSPEQSSSEAPTTARSSHSNESYWSRSMESSITSPSSPEQQSNPNSGAGAFQKISNVFTRPRSPARTSSSGGTTIWRPAKKARSPSPPPRSAPQAIPQPESHSGSNSGNASPRSRSRLRTGKFPWSRSSSPDSASTSPILAVVNHFLSPERMYNNTEDAFENTYQPPVEERMGWSRPTAAPTPTTAVPPKVNPPVPTPAPAPAPTTTRNRRNTVNAAPAPPPPAPVPAPTPVVPVQTAPKPAAAAAAAKSRINGWDGMDSMHNAPVAPSPQDYFSFGNQYPQQQMYNKPNKSANALSMFPSQPQTWEPTNYGDDYGNDYGHGMDEQYDMPAEDMYDEPPMWSAEALRALSSPSPAPAPKPATVKPVEKKEPVVVEKKETIAEKRARLAKSPTSTLSKKSSPAEAVASTTVSSAASTLRVGTVASRLAAAAAAANRKSTIAVEDATPSNTPPKPTVSLPAASVSPPKTSPVANKIKRTKTKKNSISEAPKEKEAAPVVNEEPWSMPAIRDEFGTVKTRKRGNSGASTTSRPSSPLAFLGGRSRSGSKVEPPPKPTNTKPAAAAATSFISSAFGWGAKPKASPAAAEPEPENGGFFGFSGFGWKNQPEEPPRPTAQRNMMSNRPESEHPNIFTQRNMVSNRPEPEVFAGDYDVSSSPVSTPPQKGAWKPKTSYFEPHTKPVASSPQEEEDFSNLMASMRMSMAAGNAEAPKSAFNFHDRVEDATAFQFAMPGLNNKGGDDFWSAAMDAFGVDPSPSPEEKKQLPEPVEMSRSPPRARGIKNKFEPVEPVDPKPTPIKGAKKKMMPIKAKTFTVESPTPTPTTEAEDPWNMVEPPRAERAPKPVEVPKPAFTGWFSEAADAAEEEEGTPQVVAAAELEPASPEPDSWFNVKPKAKLGAKVTKAATAEPVPAPTPAFAMTTKGAKGKKLTKVEKVEEIPEPEPVVEEAMPEPPKEDDEWPEFKPKAKKGKKAKEPEPATAAPVANKWSSFGMDNEEDELAATLAADLEEQGQTQAQAQDEADKQAEEEAAAKEAEKEAAKSNAKAPQPKTAKGGKKKGKR